MKKRAEKLTSRRVCGATLAGRRADHRLRVEANGLSNNGFAPVYSVTSQPRYGTVTVDSATGRYIYTPNSALVTPGITDSFTIGIDNGTHARLPGFEGVLQNLLHSFAIAIGVAQPDTVDRVVTVTVPGTGYYGDRTNSQYWIKQSYGNCTLIAAAMAAAQITGTEPDENQMVTWAKERTAS
jgi:hypothetical protein